jgi:hypothetical protein
MIDMAMLKNHNPIDKSELKKLYSLGMSMAEISQKYKCSIHKVVYWMRKYGILRRNHSESSYLKHNPDGDPFKIKTSLTTEDVFLLGLGIGIYWGEGNKTLEVSALRVANTDPDLIRTFLRFLSEIYGLDKKRFSYSIVCFNDVNPEDSRKYWSNELKISPEKFGKITIIAKQGKGTYRKKSRYGVCTVQGNNVKLKKIVFDEIQKIRDKYK